MTTWKEVNTQNTPLKPLIITDNNSGKEGFVLIKNVKQDALRVFLSSSKAESTKKEARASIGELHPKVYRTVREYLSDYAVNRLFSRSNNSEVSSIKIIATRRSSINPLSPSNLSNTSNSPSSFTHAGSNNNQTPHNDGNKLDSSESEAARQVQEESEVSDAQHDINELRRIVVMFIKFKPSCETTTSEDTLAFYQLCMALTVEALTECEGQLRQFAVDDKTENGCAALCVWGLPPQSHEVEELFALKMALKIRHGVMSMGIKTNIGIAAGPAFTGVLLRPDFHDSHPMIFTLSCFS